jgi:hypothetical protein
VPITQVIITAAGEVSTRLLVVDAAVTLGLSNRKEITVLSTEDFIPDAVVPIATGDANARYTHGTVSLRIRLMSLRCNRSLADFDARFCSGAVR